VSTSVTVNRTLVEFSGGRSLGIVQGGRGVKGDKGDPSTGAEQTTHKATVTVPLSALRVVKPNGTDLAYCDGDTAVDCGKALGVTSTATGGAGGEIDVVTGGKMTDALWSWTSGAKLYCGANGALVADPEAPTAFAQQVAVADSATSIIVGVKLAIKKG
jgi:hypothetical protein